MTITMEKKGLYAPDMFRDYPAVFRVEVNDTDNPGAIISASGEYVKDGKTIKITDSDHHIRSFFLNPATLKVDLPVAEVA